MLGNWEVEEESGKAECSKREEVDIDCEEEEGEVMTEDETSVGVDTKCSGFCFGGRMPAADDTLEWGMGVRGRADEGCRGNTNAETD